MLASVLLRGRDGDGLRQDGGGDYDADVEVAIGAPAVSRSEQVACEVRRKRPEERKEAWESDGKKEGKHADYGEVGQVADGEVQLLGFGGNDDEKDPNGSWDIHQAEGDHVVTDWHEAEGRERDIVVEALMQWFDEVVQRSQSPFQQISHLLHRNCSSVPFRCTDGNSLDLVLRNGAMITCRFSKGHIEHE